MGNICSTSGEHTTTYKQARIANSKKDIQFNPGTFVQENRASFDSIYDLSNCPIGTGAFAEVWLCVHKRTKDTRAVKIFKKLNFSEKEVKCRSVFDEVEILKTLDHPNINSLY